MRREQARDFEVIKVLEHTPTERCLAERSFLRELEGGIGSRRCQH